MTTVTPRIAPLDPPFEPSVAETLNRLMGPAASAVDPLALFRLVARHDGVLDAFRKTGSTLLSFGRLPADERETIIHRVCARTGCEYEWGVHAVVFASGLELGEDWLRATVHESGETSTAFTERQAVLVRVVDSLHETSSMSDALWAELAAGWDEPSIIEILALVGFYHLVAFLANAARLPPEPWAARFPEPISA